MINNNFSNLSLGAAPAFSNAAAMGRARNQQNALFAQSLAARTMQQAAARKQQEDSPLAKQLKEMKEAMKQLSQLQDAEVTPAKARKRAAQQKIVSLRDRVKQLEGVLAKNGPISRSFAKSTARELKDIAKQLAAAVRELKNCNEGGEGAGGGGVDLGAIAAAVGATIAAPGEGAEGSEGSEASEACEGAEQAAAQAAEAEQTAREAERQAEEGAQAAQEASEDAQAAAQNAAQTEGTDASRAAGQTPRSKESDDVDMSQVIDEVKSSLRNAARMLRERLRDSQQREKKDLDEVDAILRKMDDEALQETVANAYLGRLASEAGAGADFYGADGVAGALQSALGALLYEQA
ncbi:MAG: hypothetical protein J5820_05225 [Rhodocyclaceae bacterium]|nr:hypothetical protein [Rhodocyclaceae bacterium]